VLAALTTARGKNGTASTGAHPQPEAMNLRPPTVVRLERTLAHWSSTSTIRDLLRIQWGQPVNGMGDTGTGQTGQTDGTGGYATVPVPPVRSTIGEHCGFPRASRSGGLGCGKLMSAHRSPAHRRPHGGKPQYGGYSARSVPGEPSRSGQVRARAARYVHTMWTVLWTTSVVTDQALATRLGEGSASVTDTDLTDVWARSLEGLAELHVQPS